MMSSVLIFSLCCWSQVAAPSRPPRPSRLPSWSANWTTISGPGGRAPRPN